MLRAAALLQLGDEGQNRGEGLAEERVECGRV
jgi:hypothetical protein